VFVDRQSFDDLVEDEAFLEWAEFLGERYGTPWPSPPGGSDVLLEIDLQGAEQVRRRHPEAIVVMLLPPSPEVQAERLRMRGDDPETIARRVEVGRLEEERGRSIADAVVVNDDVERAVSQVVAIIERNRTPLASPSASDPPRRIPLARRRPTLMDPPVEDLLDKVDSKFTLVALSSKRARQINSYYNQLGESLGVIVPPQVTSVSGKPLTIAFEEIAGSKTTYHRTDLEDLEIVEEDAAGTIVETAGLEPGEITLADTATAAADVVEAAQVVEAVDIAEAVEAVEAGEAEAGDPAPAG
jgi:DNA-directed RNA polymerase omega subunit